MSLHNSSDSLQTLSGVLEDFFAFARKALQAGADLSNAQSESVDPQDHEKVISGLDAVIAQVDSLIETYDLDDQNLYLFGHALHDQASALKCRFQLLEDISDLNRCIFALGCVLHFCDPSDLQHLYNLFMNQMHALMMHHIATDDRNDVDRTIETIEWLLASPHCTGPERTYVATFLAYELDFRVESEGREEDVRRVLKFCDDMLPSAERESLWHLLQLRTTSLASLSRFGRRVIDPHQALCLLRKDHDAILSDEAPSITKELVSQAVDIFLRLELVDAVITVDRDLAEEVEQELYTRCRPRLVKGSREVHLPEPYLSSVADLDVLIKAFKQWQLSYPPESCHAPHREVSTLLLVLFLYYGYQLSHQPQYLRESLAIRSSSQLSPLGTYCLDMVLLREAQDDLNPIDVGRRFEEAVKVHGTCDCSPSIHVNSLARLGGRQELQLVASMSYFSEGFGTGDAGVVDVGRPGMGLMSSSIGGTEKKVQSLSALAGFHHAQWRKSGDVEELKKAVKLLQQAVDGIQDDDQSREAWLARCDWAQVLLELCSVGQASPLEKLRLAFDYIRIFVTDKIHLAHSPRLAFVSNWFHYLPFVWKFEGFLDHVPEMCELALSLLEEQLWAVSGPRSSIDGRWPTHSLHIDAAFFSLFIYHRPDGTKVKRSLLPITRAIEILEAGQSTVWNQIARLRPPIDKLASVNPTLASRFEELSSTLKNHLVSPEPAPDPLGAQGWRVYQDRTQIIEEIRALSGFESFLKLKSPKEFENAGLDGPVVILLPHIAQCVAIVLFVRNYTIVSLPITLKTIEGMHRTLQVLAKTRGESSENAGDVNSPSGSDDEAHSLDPDSEDSTQVRSLRRKGPPEPQMNLVLETLWKEVAELIVDRITSFTMGKKGDLAAIASEKPVSPS